MNDERKKALQSLKTARGQIDGIRLQRALDREKNQENPNFDELCRRFLADNSDFSKENLSTLKINEFYTNKELEECINNIKKDILNLI